MNKTLQPKFKTEICDNCKKEFFRIWTRSIRDYSKVNLVSHWTGSEKIDWKGNKLLCAPCLIKWYKEEKAEFRKIVPYNRYRTFDSYLRSGLIKEYKG